jgi:hypothetical protein
MSASDRSWTSLVVERRAEAVPRRTTGSGENLAQAGNNHLVHALTAPGRKFSKLKSQNRIAGQSAPGRPSSSEARETISLARRANEAAQFRLMPNSRQETTTATLNEGNARRRQHSTTPLLQRLAVTLRVCLGRVLQPRRRSLSLSCRDGQRKRHYTGGHSRIQWRGPV